MRGRVLRFLGSGKACCDYLGVLLKPGYEAASLQDVVRVVEVRLCEESEASVITTIVWTLTELQSETVDARFSRSSWANAR